MRGRFFRSEPDPGFSLRLGSGTSESGSSKSESGSAALGGKTRQDLMKNFNYFSIYLNQAAADSMLPGDAVDDLAKINSRSFFFP